MSKTVKFGVFADLHIPLIPDTVERLTAFLEDCRNEDVDFIVQLGDFAYPEDPVSPLCKDYSPNEKVIPMFNNFEKPSFHVIGNHDCDTANKEEILAFWGQKHKPYYSFDMNGYHFAVLDCNYLKIDGEYISYDHANYFALNKGPVSRLPYIPDKQIAWLKEDLDNTPYPTILFSHQRLCHDLKNAADLKKVIDNAPNKVLMSVNGHEHMDEAEKIDGVWYYNVNSISMQWLGENFAVKERYGKEMDEIYPWLCCTVPYDKPVYAIITVDEAGAKVRGTNANFVGPAPEEIGVYDEGSSFMTEMIRVKITPAIEDRYMEFE